MDALKDAIKINIIYGALKNLYNMEAELWQIQKYLSINQKKKLLKTSNTDASSISNKFSSINFTPSIEFQ